MKVEIHPTDHLETLRRCGGYYECLKDAHGKRLGPLVGYAGKYCSRSQPGGKPDKQWVGEVYANFAKADENLHVLRYYAQNMGDLGLYGFDSLCAMPLGGYAFADVLGLMFSYPVIRAEKKVTVLATETSREQSELVFARHSVQKGAKYAIVEDVCNNWSTTEKGIDLICRAGATVEAIVCLLNRSLNVDSHYQSTTMSRDIPVINLVRKAIPEYRQDDPYVAEDIAKGNVVWKPKDEWDRLAAVQ